MKDVKLACVHQGKSLEQAIFKIECGVSVVIFQLIFKALKYFICEDLEELSCL